MEDRIDRLLDSKVVYRVPIVCEEDINEVFPDVVHIALYCSEDDRSFRLRRCFVHVWFKDRDSLLHGLCAL